jgi:hypothetical protein
MKWRKSADRSTAERYSYSPKPTGFDKLSNRLLVAFGIAAFFAVWLGAITGLGWNTAAGMALFVAVCPGIPIFVVFLNLVVGGISWILTGEAYWFLIEWFDL